MTAHVEKHLPHKCEDQISGSLELRGKVRCVDSNPGDVEMEVEIGGVHWQLA